MEEFRIDIDFNILFKNNLKLEEWLILYCLYDDKETLLTEYVTKCGGIPTEVFIGLKSKQFLSIDDTTNINFDTIKLTSMGDSLFRQKVVDIQEDFIPLYNEMKACYPSKGKTRRFYADDKRCKKLYFQTLVKGIEVDKDLHEKIKKCILLYYHEHKKSDKVDFMQALVTFLHQRTWEQYLLDINKEIPKFQKTNFDAI